MLPIWEHSMSAVAVFVHWRYEGRLARLEPCRLEGNIRESVEQFRIFVGLLTASVP
jgi:hypothetical protein